MYNNDDVHSQNEKYNQQLNNSMINNSTIILNQSQIPLNDEPTFIEHRKETADFPNYNNENQDLKNQINEVKNKMSESAYGMTNLDNINLHPKNIKSNISRKNELSGENRKSSINPKCINFTFDFKNYKYSLSNFNPQKVGNKCSIKDIETFLDEIYKALPYFNNIKKFHLIQKITILISILILLAGMGCIIANAIINQENFVQQSLFYISIGLFCGFILILLIGMIIIPVLMMKPGRVIKPKIDAIIDKYGKTFEYSGLKWKCPNSQGLFLELWDESKPKKLPNLTIQIDDNYEDKYSKIYVGKSVIIKEYQEQNDSNKSSMQYEIVPPQDHKDDNFNRNYMNTNSGLIPTQNNITEDNNNDHNKYKNLYFKDIENNIQNQRVLNTNIGKNVLNTNESNIIEETDSIIIDNEDGFTIDANIINVEGPLNKNIEYTNETKLKRSINYLSPEKH